LAGGIPLYYMFTLFTTAAFVLQKYKQVKEYVAKLDMTFYS